MSTSSSKFGLKIGILLLMIAAGTTSCKRTGSGREQVVRFEKMAFTIPAGQLRDSILLRHHALVPFFRIFNEEVIRIGPDSLPGYSDQLQRFTADTMIRNIGSELEKHSPEFQDRFNDIGKALQQWAAITGGKRPDLVTYISGFNQSFITLPWILGIGIDNYLGGDSPFYRGLDIPQYIRNTMKPENLPADAIRAWLYSELPALPEDGGFIERMIYEGKVYYITKKLLPGISDENLFHYSKQQLKWCIKQEQAMWKYLAEQKILFSTNRLTIRKFMEEAPFTRDFGNESPGRVGIWIGYRIICSYIKSTGADLKDLPGLNDAKAILSGSKYHP